MIVDECKTKSRYSYTTYLLLVIKMAKLYRPRGTYTKTNRIAWITNVWYHNKKTALMAVADFNARRTHTNIKIIESSKSGTYKGKHIKASQIDKYYYE